MSNRKTIQTRLVFPKDTNAHNTLFGGQLMSYIDDVSSIAAIRYARRILVTGSTDSVDFIHPINANHSVTLEAFVSGAGHRSLEVFCKVIGESLEPEKTYLAATAFTTFVVVDQLKEPLPFYIPETPEEKLVSEAYLVRKEQRRKRRLYNIDFVEKLIDINLGG